MVEIIQIIGLDALLQDLEYLLSLHYDSGYYSAKSVYGTLNEDDDNAWRFLREKREGLREKFRSNLTTWFDYVKEGLKKEEHTDLGISLSEIDQLVTAAEEALIIMRGVLNQDGEAVAVIEPLHWAKVASELKSGLKGVKDARRRK